MFVFSVTTFVSFFFIILEIVSSKAFSKMPPLHNYSLFRRFCTFVQWSIQSYHARVYISSSNVVYSFVMWLSPKTFRSLARRSVFTQSATLEFASHMCGGSLLRHVSVSHKHEVCSKSFPLGFSGYSLLMQTYRRWTKMETPRNSGIESVC